MWCAPGLDLLAKRTSVRRYRIGDHLHFKQVFRFMTGLGCLLRREMPAAKPKDHQASKRLGFDLRLARVCTPGCLGVDQKSWSWMTEMTNMSVESLKGSRHHVGVEQ